MNKTEHSTLLKKILVCDDATDISELIKLVLESEGYIVETSNSAALAIFKIQDNRPDLFISDILMPDMDGYSLVNHIENVLDIKDLKILFLTGSLENDFKKSNIGKRFQICQKPLNVNELIDTVKSFFV